MTVHYSIALYLGKDSYPMWRAFDLHSAKDKGECYRSLSVKLELRPVKPVRGVSGKVYGGMAYKEAK